MYQIYEWELWTELIKLWTLFWVAYTIEWLLTWSSLSKSLLSSDRWWDFLVFAILCCFFFEITFTIRFYFFFCKAIGYFYSLRKKTQYVQKKQIFVRVYDEITYIFYGCNWIYRKNILTNYTLNNRLFALKRLTDVQSLVFTIRFQSTANVKIQFTIQSVAALQSHFYSVKIGEKGGRLWNSTIFP